MEIRIELQQLNSLMIYSTSLITDKSYAMLTVSSRRLMTQGKLTIIIYI
jgi:hypothetical protein